MMNQGVVKFRDWILHIKQTPVMLASHRTVVLRVLSQHKIAVARSYCSRTDSFSKKKGACIALNRMKCFIAAYDKDPLRYMEYSVAHEVTGRGVTLFEVISPEKLSEDEKEFFDRVIVPRLKKENLV